MSDMIAKSPDTRLVNVGKRGTIVIPAEFRRTMKIEEGSMLDGYVDEDGRLVLEVVPSDPIERLRWAAGGVFDGIDAVAYVRSLRDEWPD